MPILNREQVQVWLRLAEERGVDPGLRALLEATVDLYEEWLAPITDIRQAALLIGPDEGLKPRLLPVAGTNLEFYIIAHQFGGVGPVRMYEVYDVRPAAARAVWVPDF